MPNQAEVESFKITPEMKKFASTYRKFNKIGTMLRGKLQFQLDEAGQTRSMLGQIEKGMQLLMLEAPQKPTFEVPGQESAEEPQEEMGAERQSMNPQIQY